MEKKHKFSIWYLILGILGVLLLQQTILSMFTVQVIPYSQFLKHLRDGKVAEVAISANRIQGKLKADGTGTEALFRTIRVDSDTSELLDKHNVTFNDVAGESGVPFFSISGAEFVEMFVGLRASRVRDLIGDCAKAGNRRRLLFTPKHPEAKLFPIRRGDIPEALRILLF